MPGIDNPYRNLTGGQWLRGNLHVHTTKSDGLRTPQQIINDYARLGYDFLMISDHDTYTSPKDYRRYKNKGLILIPGNEISANGPHMLHVGAGRRIEPSALRQQVINDVNASKGFVVVNHPNWLTDFDHCPVEKMQEWIGYAGLEIYNGVIGFLEGSPYATGKWDMLLSKGRCVWGFANDDCHWGGIYQGRAGKDRARVGTDQGLGWNMAYVKRNTAAGVVEALQAGRFYASNGVTIDSIRVRGKKITIQAANARRIVALRQSGARLAVSDDSVIEVEVPDDATYVRFECWGDGESFAWTQPFFVR